MSAARSQTAIDTLTVIALLSQRPFIPYSHATQTQGVALADSLYVAVPVPGDEVRFARGSPEYTGALRFSRLDEPVVRPATHGAAVGGRHRMSDSQDKRLLGQIAL
jgi:hypothetical protein